ncbi:uncharacterized protein LOC134763020 [Penaeus indicus]|uniref:uncharacterized protein LOC134763020 n=1 Tax=Penaeus indicus TaxID=29960 RepID=UPI00300D3ADF
MDGLVGVIEDWLGYCDSTNDSKQIYECLQSDPDQLMHAIYTLFDERSRCPDLFENTVRQLFALARSKDERLREFVLLFAPSLLYIYLSSISFGEKKGVGSVEVALLALYNMEVLDEQGQPRIAPFRLPTLARQSVFHEPASLAPASFTVDSLQRLEAGDAETVRWGPPTQMTSVTAATRHHLATAIMVAFNARLATLPKIALMHLCKAASKIVSQGFNRPGHHHRSSYGSESSFSLYPRPTPRIPVTTELLAELLHAVYFAIPAERSLHDLPSLMSISMPLSHFHYSSHNAAKGGGTQCPAMMPNCAGQCYHSPHVKLRRFNEFASLGIQALEDLHMRAQYELFGDVLLMTNAIKNSLKVNPSGQPSDGPMGISVALTPLTTTAPLSKSFITNASFRTKKLPDDIPIQHTEDGKPLTSICEEGDLDDKSKPIRTPQGSGREKDIKDKDGREKDKEKEKEGKEKKFVSTNIPIPNLVKRRDKEKAKNGDRKESEKRSEKREKHKHDKDKDKDKENRNGTSSNRNSAIMNSDSDGGGTDVTIITNQQQQSQQQQFEMKVIIKSPRHYETSNSAEDYTPPTSENEEGKVEEDLSDHVGHQTRSPLETNGSQNHVAKVV